MIKNCFSCKHREKLGEQYPCKKCRRGPNVYINWEEKEAKKVKNKERKIMEDKDGRS